VTIDREPFPTPLSNGNISRTLLIGKVSSHDPSPRYDALVVPFGMTSPLTGSWTIAISVRDSSSVSNAILSNRRKQTRSLRTFGRPWPFFPRAMFTGQLTRAAIGRTATPKHKTGAGAMSAATEKFGAFIRRERESKEIGLREMAKKVGVSPTYLSKVERDEFSPPAEDKVRAIAKIIGCDADDLLARAGRVSSDITEIIKRRPVQLGALLRKMDGWSLEKIAKLFEQAGRLKDR
jgi:HTH-type transcriptional regulator, competence development regulator